MLARVADSCFWLSRYIERAETNARILDVNMQLMLDFEDQNPNMLHQHWQPVLATLEDQELFSKYHEKITPEAVMEFVTFAKKNPGAIISCIAAARENARTVRPFSRAAATHERIAVGFLFSNVTNSITASGVIFS